MGHCASKYTTSSQPKINDDEKNQTAAEVLPEESPKVDPANSYENIIKDSDSPIDHSSSELLLSQLHSGVYLNQMKKKYWIEQESGVNCFMIFPREFDISWGDDKRYWRWYLFDEPGGGGGGVEIAKLIGVSWFQVIGTLDTALLSPKTTYEIVFIIKLDNEASGWEIPVTLVLELQGAVQTRKLSFMTKPRAQWFELHVGDFHTYSDKMGEVKFSIRGYEGAKWKLGAHVQGAIFRPTKQL
ncbi:hypothetical protein ACHQM5_009793 [Ranunculus cassubicifolius]